MERIKNNNAIAPSRYLHFGFYFLSIFCPAILIITILIFGIYRIEVYSSERVSLSNEQRVTTLVSETITNFFNVAIKDLEQLASQNEIADIFASGAQGGLSELSEELLSYCRIKPLCLNVRVIDAGGMEILKIFREGEHVRQVSGSELQNKKGRYYFEEAMKAGRGEVYVSPMDLNMEYGVIEEPLHPVVRLATPVFDQHGKKAGVIVINYMGGKLLKRLRSVLPDGTNHQMILNMDGYWLMGGAHGDDFAFMFEEKKALKLGNFYPEMWKKISGGASGHGHIHNNGENGNYSGMDSLTYSDLVGSMGQFTFLTIYNNANGFVHDNFSSSEHFVRVEKNPSEGIKGEPYWKVVSYIPDEMVVGAHHRRYKKIYAGLFALLLIISLLYSKYMVGKSEAEDRKRESEEKLRAQEKKYRVLHENAFDGIVIADCSGLIIDSNTSVEKIFGYEEDELVGKDISILIPEMYSEKYEKGLKRFVETGEGSIMEQVLQLEGKRKSGELFPIELTLSELTIDGSLLLSGTMRDISERRKSEERIEQLAYYDQLTGLPNRVLFMDRLKQSLARARRYDTQLGLLFLDLDRFKTLNDTLGHTIGDQFLKAAAERLTYFTRSSDSVARIGGDEFVIFVADQEDVSGIMVVAGKIASIFKEPFDINGNEFFLTASIGVSAYPQDGEDVTTLMKNADTAMYRAKDEGGGGVSHYSPSMNARAIERLELENKLRRAEAREEFYLDYQPQVDSSTCKVVGVEALLRWRDEKRGIISPADFIPVAEITRLIVPIGEWVLREACEEMVRLHEDGLRDLNIAVNVSLYQLKDRRFLDTLSRILEETGLDPKYLELEITESVAMENVDESVKMLNELKSKGVRLSIDDFGTGYSSLEYLKRMPIDVLKIDMSFIRNIIEDDDDRKIVETIVNIAHGFNCKVVAEGVETPEQLKILRDFGCDIIQGYLFSRPVKPEELKGIYEEVAPSLEHSTEKAS